MSRIAASNSDDQSEMLSANHCAETRGVDFYGLLVSGINVNHLVAGRRGYTVV